MAKLAKGTGWRVSQRVLFREWDGLFVASSAVVLIGEAKTRAQLQVKPLGLDEIFWDVMDAATNRTQPQSFRYFGAFTCPMATVAEECIDEDPANLNLIAQNHLRWANQLLPDVRKLVMPFTEYLIRHPRPPDGRGPHRASLITSLVLDGDYQKARELCESSIIEHDDAGFTVLFEDRRGNWFPELVLDWLKAQNRI